MKKFKFSAGSPISWILFQNMRNLYFRELKDGLKNGTSRNGLHIFSIQALSAFPLAIATWEALINELFTSSIVKDTYIDNNLYEIIDLADKWELKRKTIEFPKFIFGRTFDTSNNLFNDFHNILQIRNNIIHFKHSLYEGPDKSLKELRQKGISYPKPSDAHCPWHMEISTTEAIKFCVNTVSQMVITLSDLETEYYKENCIPVRTSIYNTITDNEVCNVFSELDININEKCNDVFSFR